LRSEAFCDEEIGFATDAHTIDHLLAGKRLDRDSGIAALQFPAETFGRFRIFEGSHLYGIKRTAVIAQ
jgi:hypothetical protein